MTRGAGEDGCEETLAGSGRSWTGGREGEEEGGDDAEAGGVR